MANAKRIRQSANIHFILNLQIFFYYLELILKKVANSILLGYAK